MDPACSRRRSPSRRDAAGCRGPSSSSTSSARARTWIRSWTLCDALRRAGARGRGRGARRAPTRAGPPARFGAVGGVLLQRQQDHHHVRRRHARRRRRGDGGRARALLATQARDPAPHYEHSEIGYNYRMSNVLAGIGRGQLGCSTSASRGGARSRSATATPSPACRDRAHAGGRLRAAHQLAELLPGRRGARSASRRDELIAAARRGEHRGAAGLEADAPAAASTATPSVRRRGGRGLFARGICLPSGSAA